LVSASYGRVWSLKVLLFLRTLSPQLSIGSVSTQMEAALGLIIPFLVSMLGTLPPALP